MELDGLDPHFGQNLGTCGDKGVIILIKKCSCKHEGQDKIHGKDNRVHNPKAKDEVRCTVCQRETHKDK